MSVVILQIFSAKLCKILCQVFCQSSICYRGNWIPMYICPTLQDELRLSHGLFQPSLWYLPHPDLCIITSCHGQRDACQIQLTHLSRKTGSSHYNVQLQMLTHNKCIHLPTASRCVSKGSQEKSTTLTEFWMVGRAVSGSLPGWERWGEQRNKIRHSHTYSTQ